jgi:murein DD-endopeptidase MepM/ murein hydrolase activator NlpD
MMRGAVKRAEFVLIVAFVCGAPVLAIASETIAYTYDAKGRLVKVERSGSINNGVVTNYAFDKADNRTGKTTAGSPNPGPP